MTIGPEAALPLPISPRDHGPGIEVRGLTVAYRNGLTALRDASFSSPAGTITALVGVNGSGKSTLFKAIMGFLPAARGKIRVLGMTVAEALRRNTIAYVPQAEEVDWTFPVLVEDVVMMGRYGHMGFLRRARPVDRRVVAEALKRVDMTAYRDRQIGELSGGQRKRVFLARALAQESRVILLDEPFTGVDVTTEEAIIALLRDLRDEGRVMLVSTHNLGSVPEFCDRTVLVKGTILAYGPTREIFTQTNLERAFGGTLRHFVLGGSDLHDDDDGRHVTVLTDDERAFVVYGDRRIRDAAKADPDPGDVAAEGPLAWQPDKLPNSGAEVPDADTMAPPRTDPAGTDPAGTDPARTDPARTDPASPDPTRTLPLRTSPARTVVRQPDTPESGSPQPDQPQTNQPHTDQPRTDQPPTDQPQPDPTRTDPTRTGAP